MSDTRTNLTLVVGYDGSDASRRAIARVRDLAIDYRALVVVAVAPEIRSAGMGVDLAGEPVDTERLLAEARELLDGCEGGAVETRAAAGDPAIVLTDIAREVNAQLVIVGRRGGDFVRRTLLGSVAERVVQSAPCDVLVVA
jgi:nucleotide-binding universal stress UspA family protein